MRVNFVVVVFFLLFYETKSNKTNSLKKISYGMLKINRKLISINSLIRKMSNEIRSTTQFEF